MRKLLLGVIGGTLILLGAASPAFATTSYLYTYYGDAGHTVIVGYLGVDCTGHGYFYGTETGYYTFQSGAC